MQRPERSQIGKLIPLFLALMFITLCCSEKAAPPVSGPTVSLPALELEAFGALPPAKPEAVTPALQDQTVTLEKAVNYKQVMAFLQVRLTPGQKKFLNEHRFLLLPKSATRFQGQTDLGKEGFSYDEMLGLFDEVSGFYDEMQRQPENCHFVNPDVMLHAFHKYLENSLEYLEKTELAGTLRRFLTHLQAKALEDKAAASGPLAEHYELIAAQLTVPLVILENAHWPAAEELEEIASQPPEVPLADDGDTLDTDLVMVGLGATPATAFLHGLPLAADGSVPVDRYLQVQAGVYAAGDIARFPDWRTQETIRIRDRGRSSARTRRRPPRW